jgi:hypothetical protein
VHSLLHRSSTLDAEPASIYVCPSAGQAPHASSV